MRGSIIIQQETSFLPYNSTDSVQLLNKVARDLRSKQMLLVQFNDYCDLDQYDVCIGSVRWDTFDHKTHFADVDYDCSSEDW